MRILPMLLAYAFLQLQCTSRNTENDLSGLSEITIDVSRMKETDGKFMLMIGGEVFHPNFTNNKFTFQKEINEPFPGFFSYYPNAKIKDFGNKQLNEIPADTSDYYQFLVVPGSYQISVIETVARSIIVNTSASQTLYRGLLESKRNFDKNRARAHSSLIDQINKATSKKIRDSLMQKYSNIYMTEYPVFFQDSIVSVIESNPDEPASLLELENYSNYPGKDLKTLTYLFNNLTERIQKLPTARRVYNIIDQEKFSQESLLGKKVIDFVQNDQKGNPIRFSKLKGEMKLIEFWASWCGPCRQSNPALLKLFEKYKNKGFNILGVSLDNEALSWTNAIKDDQLTWTQVSDLKGFENAAAKAYHITSIPSNILVDNSGKIIATNLDMNSLSDRLAALD